MEGNGEKCRLIMLWPKEIGLLDLGGGALLGKHQKPYQMAKEIAVIVSGNKRVSHIWRQLDLVRIIRTKLIPKIYR